MVARESFDELAEPANGLDEMLLGGGVLDEGVEGSRLVDVACRIEGAVDPFLDEVKDCRDGFVVVFIALGAVANLCTGRLMGVGMKLVTVLTLWNASCSLDVVRFTVSSPAAIAA